MASKVGINGFGRIGRNFFRAVAKTGARHRDRLGQRHHRSARVLAHLLKYDSVHGVLDAEVKATGDGIAVDGKETACHRRARPGRPAVEGARRRRRHRVDRPVHRRATRPRSTSTAGAKKVVISAPAKGEDITIVMGVNDGDYDPAKHTVISNASCTTNCVVPLAKVLHEAFGIERGFMTTVHAYTNDQNLLDLPHKDLRRARASAINIVPASTGAAKATSLTMPEMKGRLDGTALRVPCPMARSPTWSASSSARRPSTT